MKKEAAINSGPLDGVAGEILRAAMRYVEAKRVVERAQAELHGAEEAYITLVGMSIGSQEQMGDQVAGRTVTDRILRFLEDKPQGLSSDRIAQAVRATKSTVQSVLSRLGATGKVKRLSKGIWSRGASE